MATDEIELNNVETVSRIEFDGGNAPLWCVATDALGAGSTFYSADDWDLQIKLKRKPKPFKVGDRVHTLYSTGVLIIDAVSETFGAGAGAECWVRLGDGSHSTYEACYLKHAAPEVTTGIEEKQNA